jgi:hypothetical protein
MGAELSALRRLEIAQAIIDQAKSNDPLAEVDPKALQAAENYLGAVGQGKEPPGDLSFLFDYGVKTLDKNTSAIVLYKEGTTGMAGRKWQVSADLSKGDPDPKKANRKAQYSLKVVALDSSAWMSKGILSGRP